MKTQRSFPLPCSSKNTLDGRTSLQECFCPFKVLGSIGDKHAGNLPQCPLLPLTLLPVPLRRQTRFLHRLRPPVHSQLPHRHHPRYTFIRFDLSVTVSFSILIDLRLAIAISVTFDLSFSVQVTVTLGIYSPSPSASPSPSPTPLNFTALYVYNRDSAYQTDAWTINFGYIVSNSLFFNEKGVLSQQTIWLWAIPGDTLTGFDWLPLGPQIVSGKTNATDFSVTFVESNNFGYSILKVHAVLPEWWMFRFMQERHIGWNFRTQ